MLLAVVVYLLQRNKRSYLSLLPADVLYLILPLLFQKTISKIKHLGLKTRPLLCSGTIGAIDFVPGMFSEQVRYTNIFGTGETVLYRTPSLDLKGITRCIVSDNHLVALRPNRRELIVVSLTNDHDRIIRTMSCPQFRVYDGYVYYYHRKKHGRSIVTKASLRWHTITNVISDLPNDCELVGVIDGCIVLYYNGEIIYFSSEGVEMNSHRLNPPINNHYGHDMHINRQGFVVVHLLHSIFVYGPTGLLLCQYDIGYPSDLRSRAPSGSLESSSHSFPKLLPYGSTIAGELVDTNGTFAFMDSASSVWLLK